MDFETLADEAQAPQDLLQQVTELAEQQIEIENEIAKQTAKLKELNAKLLRISGVDLPTAMQSAGLVSLGMKDGSTIKIEHGIAASITEATHERAIRWLIDNNFGDLIKRSVQINFSRGEDERQAKLLELLEREGYDEFAVAENVHPQTLKAFVREQTEKGTNIPPEAFNLYPYTKTKIVKPKK